MVSLEKDLEVKVMQFSSTFLVSLLLLTVTAQAETPSLWSQAEAALTAKDYTEVFRKIEEVSAAGPLPAEWQELRARALYQSRNFEEAIAAYLKLQQLSPARGEACAAELGDCYVLSGQPLLAEPYYRKAIAAGELVQLRWLLSQIMQGKKESVEMQISKLDDGLLKSFAQAAQFYAQDKKEDGDKLVAAALKTSDNRAQSFWHALKDMDWAKDVTLEPTTTSTTAP
jgi:tetratricopeptide (TPR) repeat protein